MRLKTLREIKTTLLKRTGGDPIKILEQYVKSPHRRASEEYRNLHKAAILELTALPLTKLFIHLYNNQGVIRGSIPPDSKLDLYRVNPQPPGLLSDLSAHLRLATKLGGEKFELSLPRIKSQILLKHQNAKPEGAWVDDLWRVIRHGLAPQNPPGIHGFRLAAFASLVRDIGGRV